MEGERVVERRKAKEKKVVKKRGRDYDALSAGVNAIRQRGRRTLALVLFTVRERKLRKLGAGRTVEAARADAARQILKHVGAGEKVSLEKSVIHLESRRASFAGTSRIPGRLGEGCCSHREQRDKDAVRHGTDEFELAEEGTF